MFIKPRVLTIAVIFCLLSIVKSNAQCVLTVALPDTIHVCRNTQLQLSPTLITSAGSAVPTDTTWTPATGLSNDHSMNPIASIGTTDVQYKLVVNSITSQNFVVNGDFSGGNTGFNSSYADTSGFNSLWPEGHYAIVTNPNSVHSNFASFGDHTTGTGNMMVINGASNPVNIWCQTITVTPNTQYDFSAWGASTTTGSPAQLQFEIDGNLVGSSLQLPAVNGQWVEFHVVWNSGPSTSITICIHDQQTALSGNDFAIDDITFRQICTTTDSVYVKVDNIVPAIDKVIKLGCISDTVSFTALNTGTAPDHYTWSFGDASQDTTKNPVHVYTYQGQYTIRLDEWTNIGCSDFAQAFIDTRHGLEVSFVTDRDTICASESIQFTSNDLATILPIAYYWDFGDGNNDNTQTPMHTYTTPGIYNVIHIGTDGVPCSDTMIKPIVVLANPTIALTLSDSNICAGRSIKFDGALYEGYDSIIWDFGDHGIINNVNPVQHSFDKEGDYTVNLTATYTHCPDISITHTVKVFNSPLVNLGGDTSMCPGSSPIRLVNYALDPNPASYFWSTGDEGTTSAANQPGVYWLRVTNAGGCSVVDSMEVRRSCYLDIPNAFSPNGDGVNDYFFPRQFLSKQLVKFHMDIYNRWGEVLFTTDNIDGRGWDGKYNDKAQPSGVYIYMIDAIAEGQPEERVHGNVTLMR